MAGKDIDILAALNEYNSAISKLQKTVNSKVNKPLVGKPLIDKIITFENISEVMEVHRMQLFDIHDSLYRLKKTVKF